MISQFLSLERRTARGGRDSIDHPPGGKDDLANAVAGVLVFLASARYQPAKTYIGTWGNPTGLPKPTKFPDGPITDPDDPLFGGNAVSAFRL